jgi:hypothetical protein
LAKLLGSELGNFRPVRRSLFDRNFAIAEAQRYFQLTLPALKRRRFLRPSGLNIPIARVSGRNPFAKNGGLLS